MTRIGFIGLGIMGLPMANNLVDAGFEVVGYNRSPEKSARLAEHGGTAAATVGDAVAGADVVITMLPDSPDVEEVVLGSVLAGMRPGALFIDMSSIAPAVSVRIAEQAKAEGIGCLDAPVSGGEQAAIDGTLSIMVGGSAEDFAAAKPVLDAVGSTIVTVGPAGSGQTVKAANQLIVAGNIQIVAEALTFLGASGVDLDAAIEVLSGGLAGSRILDRKAASMVRGEFAPGFRSELHHKDLGIGLAAARDAGVVTPVAALLAQLMASLVGTGHGGLDHSALILGVQRLSGRSAE